VARFGGKDVPTDGINAAAKTVGDLALSLMIGIGHEIWPPPNKPKAADDGRAWIF
jgi:hypothetical protein